MASQKTKKTKTGFLRKERAASKTRILELESEVTTLKQDNTKLHELVRTLGSELAELKQENARILQKIKLGLQ